MLAKRDRAVLDDVARGLGQWLTNLMEETERYLRADLERRAIATRPVWRRYRRTKRPPFVRKVRAYDLREPDEYGIAKAGY